MKSKEIIRLAEDAGLLEDYDGEFKNLEMFAHFIAQQERKACIQICESYGAWNETAQTIADEIRMRS